MELHTTKHLPKGDGIPSSLDKYGSTAKLQKSRGRVINPSTHTEIFEPEVNGGDGGVVQGRQIEKKWTLVAVFVFVGLLMLGALVAKHRRRRHASARF